jgi:type IV secretory pathway VirB2 component (pilin)
MKKGLKMEIYKAYMAVTAFIIGMIPFHALAAGKTWPWTNFLKDLQDELTGPLPTTLGIMGIVIACVGLFTGNAGDGVRKFLVIILAISIALFAPTIVSWLAN